MTLDAFESAVLSAEVGKHDKIFPRWLRRYAFGFPGGLNKQLTINRAAAIRFSKSLLDKGAPAWQRLQAVRSLACYRDLVLKKSEPDLSFMIKALAQLASAERRVGLFDAPTQDELKLLRGKVNPREPQLIQTMRGEMRVLHYAYDTEKAYVKWVKRFIDFVGSSNLEQFDDKEIADFLSDLAVRGQVSPSTQNQAQCGLLFLYQCVIGKKIGFLNATRARKPEKIPVWFSVSEIKRLLPHFVGVQRLMFLLIYGAGLRHKECRRLRIKDVCFDEGHIIVRDGKGAKDRITFLPEQAISGLQQQIAVAKRMHEIDVEQGFEQVQMPYALARKYPNACKELAWKWVFPSRQRAHDKRSGKVWRHHVAEELFCDGFKRALRLSGINKNGVPHSLRHSFANACTMGCSIVFPFAKCSGRTANIAQPVAPVANSALLGLRHPSGAIAIEC